MNSSTELRAMSLRRLTVKLDNFASLSRFQTVLGETRNNHATSGTVSASYPGDGSMATTGLHRWPFFLRVERFAPCSSSEVGDTTSSQPTPFTEPRVRGWAD